MKKLITILVIAIVMVSAVFADPTPTPGGTLTLTSTVAPHAPAFKLYGIAKVDNTTAISETDTYLATTSKTTIASTKDISVENITVLCRVRQDSNVTGVYSGSKSKFRGTAAIAVVASTLKTTIGSDSFETAAPAATLDTTNGIHVANGVSVVTANTAASANRVDIKLSYTGNSVQDSAVYADFSFEWTKKDELPPGDYSADITMTYTVQ